MGGRAGGRAAGARRAAQDRMRSAAAALRAGEPGDPTAVREATARLLDRLADREVDVHLHGDGANLADRILAGDPYRSMEGGAGPLPPGYDNGQRRQGP